MRFFPIFIASIFLTDCFAQLDPIYSQYQFNQSLINPAYVGVHDVFNATLNSRFQWVGLEGAPKTNSLNISSSMANNSMGLGLQVVSDHYGVNRNTDLQLMYSYRIEMLGNKILSFGLQGGLINYGYDYSGLNLEFNDPVLNNNDNFSTPNFGTGVFFMTPDYFVGLSVPRILNADINTLGSITTRYRRHYYLSAGYLFDQLLPVKFKPSILMKVTNERISYDITAQVLLVEALWLGLTFRDFESTALLSQFEINDRFRIGYTFEYPLNTLRSQKLLSHEFMLMMDLELLGRHALGRRYF